MKPKVEPRGGECVVLRRIMHYIRCCKQGGESATIARKPGDHQASRGACDRGAEAATTESIMCLRNPEKTLAKAMVGNP